MAGDFQSKKNLDKLSEFSRELKRKKVKKSLDSSGHKKALKKAGTSSIKNRAISVGKPFSKDAVLLNKDARLPVPQGSRGVAKKGSTDIIKRASGEVLDPSPKYSGSKSLTKLPDIDAKAIKRKPGFAFRAGTAVRKGVGSTLKSVARIAGPGLTAASILDQPFAGASGNSPDAMFGRGEISGEELQKYYDTGEAPVPLSAEMKRKETLKQGVAIANTEAGKQAKDVLIDTQNMSSHKKAALKKSNMGEEVASGEDKTIRGATPSPKEGFMSTLALFLPAVVGGIGGALFEGAEGAAAGLEGGLAGTKAGIDLVEGIETTDLKQDKLRAETKKLKAEAGVEGGSVEDLIKQPFSVLPEFREEVGASTAFPVEVVKNGKTSFEFRTEDGRKIPSKMLKRAQEANSDLSRALSADRLAETRSAAKDSNIERFKKTTVQGEIKSLKALNDVQDLLDSKTKITGLVSFAMAKGVAKEVGNLNTDEREAASQIVGLEGKMDTLKEWLTSEMTAKKRAELEKLIAYIRPRNAARIREQSFKFAKSNAERFGMTQQEYATQILDGIGVNLEAPQQKKKEIRRQTKDGRTAIFDENKKFVRFE
jgi:hypothetical protein